MMGYLEELKAIALTALFNPTFLALLLILFFAGKFFGKLTRRINIRKILIVGYFSIFLFPGRSQAFGILKEGSGCQRCLAFPGSYRPEICA